MKTPAKGLGIQTSSSGKWQLNPKQAPAAPAVTKRELRYRQETRLRAKWRERLPTNTSRGAVESYRPAMIKTCSPHLVPMI
jgi:hypothetical protein